MKASGLAEVDAYDVHANGYGVGGVVGNAAEWTRSSGESALNDYPTIESLFVDRQLPYTRVDRVVKGVGDQGLYYRKAVDEAQRYCVANSAGYFLTGFRPVRRASSVEDVALTREVFEDFNTITTASSTFSHNGMTWSVNSTSDKCFQPSVGVAGSGGIMESSNYMRSMQLPAVSGRLCFVRLKARNSSQYSDSVYVDSSLGAAGYVPLSEYMSEFVVYQLPVTLNASDYSICLSSRYALDDIELWTVPRQ